MSPPLVFLPLGWRYLLEVQARESSALGFTCWKQILACPCPTDLFLCSYLNKQLKKYIFSCLVFHLSLVLCFFKVIKTLSHSKIALSRSRIKRRETQRPQTDTHPLPFLCPKHDPGSDCLNSFWKICFLVMVQHGGKSMIWI